MIVIAFIPYLIFISAIVISAIIAFKTQQNWATITFLTGASLGLLIIVYGIFQLFWLNHDLQLQELIMEITGYVIPPAIIIGITGYMFTSRSIYQKSEILRIENESLINKINPL